MKILNYLMLSFFIGALYALLKHFLGFNIEALLIMFICVWTIHNIEKLNSDESRISILEKKIESIQTTLKWQSLWIKQDLSRLVDKLCPISKQESKDNLEALKKLIAGDDYEYMKEQEHLGFPEEK